MNTLRANTENVSILFHGDRAVFGWLRNLTCIIFGLSLLCYLIGWKGNFQKWFWQKKMGKANRYRRHLSLLVFPMLSDWCKVITFQMLPDAIFRSKIQEQYCFSFQVLVCHGENVSIQLSSQKISVFNSGINSSATHDIGFSSIWSSLFKATATVSEW